MNVILCTTLPSLQSALARKLLPIGINLIKKSTLAEIADAIPAFGRVCFIDDISFDKKELVETITEIKKEKQKQGSRIVILTKNADENFTKLLMKAGVDTVLHSSLHHETIVDKFYTFLSETISDQHEERKFIRIKPEPNEDATLKYLSPKTNSYITGKVTDISMGGVAGAFTASDMETLAEGQTLSNAQINLSSKNILADLSLVKKGGNIAAFSFTKIRETFKDSLAEYIYNKTQKINEVKTP